MMLDALRILFGDALRHPDGHQKITDNLMAGAAGVGQGASGVRQKNRPIGLGFNQVFTLQPADDGIDCRAGHAKARGKVNRTRLARLIDQVGNHLDIILGHLGLVRPADPVELGSAVGNRLLGVLSDMRSPDVICYDL